jgi:ABC-type nitrate/sulfonate/bicarbonate transport system permease component
VTEPAGGGAASIPSGAGRRPLAIARLAGIRPREAQILSALGFLGFFALWQVAADQGWINKLFFSSPSDILTAGVREVGSPVFWSAVQTSTFAFTVGFLAAIVIGVPLGLLIGWSDLLNDLLDPWLTFFYTLPRIALAPVILLWLGIGPQSVIAIIFLGAFFAIMVNTVRGIRIVDSRLLSVASSFGASRRKLFFTVVLPGSVPLILVGLRLGVSRALIGVIIGELFAGTRGLGTVIFRSANALEMDRMFWNVIVLILIALLAVELVSAIERRFTPWRDDLSTAA